MWRRLNRQRANRAQMSVREQMIAWHGLETIEAWERGEETLTLAKCIYPGCAEDHTNGIDYCVNHMTASDN